MINADSDGSGNKGSEPAAENTACVSEVIGTDALTDGRSDRHADALTHMLML